MHGVGRKVCVQNVKAVEQQSLWILGIKQSMPKQSLLPPLRLEFYLVLQ